MLFIFCVMVLVYTEVQAKFYYNSPVFRFANHYADHMVLQKSPYKAIIWGFGEENSDVIIVVKGKRYSTVVQKNNFGENVWNVTLDQQDPGQPVSIWGISSVANKLVTIDLKDVLFGNVWFCSGQSNMQFAVIQTSTSDFERNISSGYTNIRLFTSGRYISSSPIREISNILQQWTLPSSDVVKSFSALCWMYGRRLYDIYKVPIGLISSNQGGSCVEAWSSPETLKVCNASSKYPEPYNSDNVLWNAMVSPFLKTTIYGVIWYQGEQNARNPDGYNCSFPAMINGWRKEWSLGTGGQTDLKFPFGFVQLASLTLADEVIAGFPNIRWLQTAGYGYVPNKQQENIFMAVTMDLADDHSPYGSIHPRDKADVADRLVLSARAVVFKENIYWTGPIFSKAVLCLPMNVKVNKMQNIVLYYRPESVQSYGIQIVSLDGFEVLLTNGSWVSATVSYTTNNKVLLSTSFSDIHGLRYAWKQDPCLFKSCAIYSGGSNLPSPPFVSYGPFEYVSNFRKKKVAKKDKRNHEEDNLLCQIQRNNRFKY